MMQHIANISAFRIPQSVFERWVSEGKASSDAQAVTYWCKRCGYVHPTRYLNGYVRKPCACERSEQEIEEMQRARLELWQQQQDLLKRHCTRCFNWLPADVCGRLSTRTFSHFAREVQSEAVTQAWTFVESQRGNLLFSGDCGTGKTHLAAAICNELCSRQVPCRFMTAQGLFDSIQTCIDDDASYQPLLDQAARAPVLVIDDIDKVHLPIRTGGDFQVKTLFSILNKRYLQGLPTIITTNAEDITPYIGVPAFSRLKEGPLVLIPMYGQDYREVLA